MKKLILFLMLLLPALCFPQSWIPVAGNDFDRASLGTVTEMGRYPIVVKAGNVFFFNRQLADYPGTKSKLSAAKFDGNTWTHMDAETTFETGSLIDFDGAVDQNQTPYWVLSQSSGVVVQRYQTGSWLPVGGFVAAVPSDFVNLNIGSDNLPRVLYKEGNTVKLKKFDGNQWILISETLEFNPFTSLSLQLDHEDVPYVISNYVVGSTANCFVRKFNGSAWEEVGITGFDKFGGSLVFNQDNTPYMATGSVIKMFNGASWETFQTPVSSPYTAISGNVKLAFSSNNELFAGYLMVSYPGGNSTFNIRKYSSGSWQAVMDNGFLYNKEFAAFGEQAYYLYFGPDNQPDVYRYTSTQSELLGGSSFFGGMTGETHDFSICNGIPMLAYVNPAEKAVVRLLENDALVALGSPVISEEKVRKVVLKSGTDGAIYAAYNNQISSQPSDTKITVKQLTPNGWQPVGPVNFSLSAGARFDFKVSHANEPHVLYMSGRVQKFDGNNWVFLGGSAYTGDTEARLALDAGDTPFIAFIDPANANHIAVKKRNGNIWEYVDQAGLAAYTGQQTLPRIHFDNANNLFLGFADNSGKVHIKKLQNGLWNAVGPEWVTNSKTEQFEIASSADDVLYMVHNALDDNFRSGIKVSKFNGFDWESVGAPNFSPSSVLQAKIDFTHDNTPWVAYSSRNGTQTNMQLRYFDQNTMNSAYFAGSEHEFVLAPNPAQTWFGVTQPSQIKRLEIFDLTGKRLLRYDQVAEQYDISDLTAGIYLVKLYTSYKTATLKLIKR